MADGISNALPLEDYRRYGRQMILDGFGLPGQTSLKRSSVAVVGAGGLGCPALQYLASAGVGKITVVDHDSVDLSNLQRQVIHRESSLGTSKAASAMRFIHDLNSTIQVTAVENALSSENALALLGGHDVILDCTDNAPTRYLLSDTAVRLQVPLVSGAAQKFDGQLCVYNYGADGPCYRCIFPKPPSQEAAPPCEETGILGAVTGIIGTMQALETIKILTGLHDGKPAMLLFSALSFPAYRTVKMRTRRPDCIACGNKGANIDLIETTDYIASCGGVRPNFEATGLLPGSPGQRIRVQELYDMVLSNRSPFVIDVRPETEFGICHLPGSSNIPLPRFVAEPSSHIPKDRKDVYFICRLGNDSQIAAEALRGVSPELRAMDIVGGLRAWSRDIDSEFPVY